MPERPTASNRVRVDGRFFRAGRDRWRLRGVTYGSFARNAAGEPFPVRAAAEQDLDLIAELGANLVRVYDVPPLWLLDAAGERGLRVLAGLPWGQETRFLETRTSRRGIRTAITTSIQALGGHPALFGVTVGNEIQPDIVRWSGVKPVEAFLEELVRAVHDLDPGCLCTYANYPPTEFLQPLELDFVAFNVFLHSRPALAQYLHHLHHLAAHQPLVLSECGIDAGREGVARQAEILAWTLETATHAGLAGAIVFCFTDEWVRNDQPVEDWHMGLTSTSRQPRPAFHAVRERFHAPDPTPPRSPKVSVVVATYNGGRTLGPCLDALLELRHPDYEILVVDDGSTDDTPQITARYPQVRTLRLPRNQGLSHARNLGIRAATGELIAFTDSDCRPDPDWLLHLVTGLVEAPVVGVGGPNLLPPEDPPLAAVVDVAPGAPAHVMLDDRFAEHLPGCNMAFWKWALDAVGGFDPVFRQAGDDVDLCWRMQRRGWRLGFSPAAFVWHHRRATLGGYLRQQAGYGAAEGLLLSKHPAQFNLLGAARWSGRICTAARTELPWQRSAIHRGLFATGLFQTLYTAGPDSLIPAFTSFAYHLLVALPLLVLAFPVTWLRPVTLVACLIPVGAALIAAHATALVGPQHRPWSRALLALLFYLQPLVRGLAQLRARLSDLGEAPENASLQAESRFQSESSIDVRSYRAQEPRDRREWADRILVALENAGWPCRADSGWNAYDFEVFGSRWARLTLTTLGQITRDRGQMLHCRLRPHWTLSGTVLFWGVLAFELILFGLFHVNWKGTWIPLVSLAGIAWFLHAQGRILQAKVSVLLDEVAEQWDLQRHEGP
ncbi:MAG: glycosyltransferase [Verrucomicrobiales bacterium]|nr:glycosyltransferase [Verrucomicrobiales bacterium]